MATKNTTAPRLEVRGIRKTFGQNAVLKGINPGKRRCRIIEKVEIEKT